MNHMGDAGTTSTGDRVEPAPKVYGVICVMPGGGHFRVKVEAETPEQAEAAAAAQGHRVRLVLTPDLTSEQERSMLLRLDRVLTSCPECGYSLEHLPRDDDGYVRCPECGAKAGAVQPAVGRRRPVSQERGLAVLGAGLGVTQLGLLMMSTVTIPGAGIAGVISSGLAMWLSGGRHGSFGVSVSGGAVVLSLLMFTLR
jgi:hypothetical protein